MARAIFQRYDWDEENKHEQVWIFCPGCGYIHAINPKIHRFNGNYDLPTFEPSLLCDFGGTTKKCHSYVRDGRIQFLGDCDHELRNQTVDLPEMIKGVHY